MDSQLQTYLANALELYPHALERAFPRIVHKIVAAWPFPKQGAAVFDELLVDRRGGRQGFPPEIASELFKLSNFYADLQRRAPKSPDVWEHEPTVDPPHELGLPMTPSQMLHVAKDGDIEGLRRLLRAGMPIDARDAREWTPLMVAAFHGREETAKFLIESGANPRARDLAGYTPLHWAAFKGYAEVVALIAPRVDCNVQSKSGLTALLQAAANGHIAVVKLLLDAGADPNIGTRDGWTPLHKAVANGHHEIATLLITAGALRCARHRGGITPLALARRCDRRMLQIVETPRTATKVQI